MKFTLDEIRTGIERGGERSTSNVQLPTLKESPPFLNVESSKLNVERSPSALPLRIITDSREAGPATIFWALRGETHDGHDFVESALTAGCDAAVIEATPNSSLAPIPSPLPFGERVPEGRERGPHERPTTNIQHSTSNEQRPSDFNVESWTLNVERSMPPHPASGHLLPRGGAKERVVVEDTLTAIQNLAAWNRNRHDTKVIGITGSFGKTTTREMIHAALQNEVNSHRSPRNFNNHFGVPLTLLGLTEQHRAAIIELGASAKGEIRKLSAMSSPEIGIITGIGQAHRASFGDAREVAKAKGELAEALPKDGLLLLCGDDAHSPSLAKRTSARVAFVGTTPDCHIRARSIHQDSDRLNVRVDGTEFRIRAAGRHFARSVLFAVATAREFGLSDTQIATGLADFQAPVGRCSVEQIGSWTVIDDSYNASPEAFAAACGLLGGWQTESRRILVCGDMLELGDAATACHQEAGMAAAKSGVDRIFAIGSFSRDVVGAATEAGLDPNCGEAFHDLNFLLHRLQQTLRAGDVLLVKGSRGMRMERVIEWLRCEAASSPQKKTPKPKLASQRDNKRTPSLLDQ